MSRLKLVCEDLSVDLAPEAGGGLAGFRKGGVEAFRSALEGAAERRDPLGLSCFPMTPYVNRIERGRFTFEGQKIQLPRAGEHALHAFGWLSPWRLEASSSTSATLAFETSRKDWPWSCRSLQRLDLLPDALEIELSVENLDARAMPASLGLHPYFPGLSSAFLHAPSDGMWETDEELIPRRWRADRNGAFNQPRPLKDADLDACFTGFSGEAVLSWPDRPFKVVILAPSCRFLQVFTRSDDDSFCVEAQTAMPDAFNRPDQDTGAAIVPPGGRLTCRTRFELRPKAPS